MDKLDTVGKKGAAAAGALAVLAGAGYFLKSMMTRPGDVGTISELRLPVCSRRVPSHRHHRCLLLCPLSVSPLLRLTRFFFFVCFLCFFFLYSLE